VKPRILVDTTNIPGGGELRLMRRDDDFFIMLCGNELMSSRVSGSEQALASLACQQLRHIAAPRLLIGGLGMGFTLRAALAELPAGAAVTVAELVPAVLAWARGPLAHIAGGSLADPRVTARVGDVHDFIAAGAARYDAILLDVDNGPDGLTVAANDRLYRDGLKAAAGALRAGGILAIWSAAPDTAFANRLRRTGLHVEEVAVRATGGRKGAHHVIWLATKKARTHAA
jgi:spermidine synthase